MNCKPGDLARILKPTCGLYCELVDIFVEVIGPTTPINDVQTHPDGTTSECNGSQWEIKFHSPRPLVGADDLRTFYVMWDHRLQPIRDQPGNEKWFTAAPRSKPATTKGDTSDARGMVRS